MIEYVQENTLVSKYLQVYVCSQKATHHKKNFCAEFSIPHEEIRFNEMVGHGSYGSVYKGNLKRNIVALKRIPVPMVLIILNL